MIDGMVTQGGTADRGRFVGDLRCAYNVGCNSHPLHMVMQAIIVIEVTVSNEQDARRPGVCELCNRGFVQAVGLHGFRRSSGFANGPSAGCKSHKRNDKALRF